MNAVHGYGQLCDALDVKNARRAIVNEQSPPKMSTSVLTKHHDHHLQLQQEQQNDRRRPHPSKQRAWWQTERDERFSQQTGLAKHQQLRDDMRRHEQNVWLGKRAKQRRFEFSADQKRMLRQWFNALDADGSGKISVEELEDPMLSIGIVTDPAEIKEIVDKLDKDANALIDFQEFVDFLTPHAKHNKTALEKHEAMFMQLTKKMERQSAGFLAINTQLSMERRRFILDAITHCPSQPIADELAELRRFYQSSDCTSNSVSRISDESSGAVEGTESRSTRAAARQNKLAALKHRHQIEVRFQGLEKVFERNSSSKVRHCG
ncbi:hypothetical protein PybrP1_007886 [[Pythium] brassicae (nom. inval.)]|nr:hypothetical protein PybrP1_007886 [[Pythium] brassicae (nom. inval.)]